MLWFGIIFGAFALYYLFCAIRYNKKVRFVSKQPGRFVIAGILVAVIAVILYVRNGAKVDNLYMIGGVILMVAAYFCMKNGIGEEGVYSNGKFTQARSISFYAIEYEHNGRLGIRINTRLRDFVFNFPLEQKDAILDQFSEMGVTRRDFSGARAARKSGKK